MAAGSIFISYRRTDSGWAASNIYSDLVRHFGGKVFMDVDSIPVGDDFVRHLQDQVDRCDALIALIGQNWATPALRDRRNFMRIEIERALDKEKAVVPVLLDDARMPSEAEIPYSLDGLLSRQAVRVRRESYRVDLPNLVETLRVAAATARRRMRPRFWRPTGLRPTQQSMLEVAFTDRVPREVLDEILHHPDSLHVTKTQIRELTVMFTDVAGFTSVAEKMAAADLMTYLADFMTPFTDVILRRRGTVDKYIGDSILAFWNAPADDRTPAANACSAALDLQDVMARVNEEFAHRGHDQIRVRVALTTGPCAVGPMGSRRRFEYSCFGDTVNLASRLQAFTKLYGVPTVMDEATALAVEKRFAVLELDAVAIKGLARSRRLYGLLGDDSIRMAAGFRAFSDSYSAGCAAYLARDWDRAVQAFTAAAECSVPGVETAALCETRLSQIKRH